jgi:TetR/AcrR family transcriptional regulator
MSLIENSELQRYVLQFEQEGLVRRTFRRLDPERQQAILAAIIEEAGERGPGAMNIKQVAQRAGVSVGSLYQYFGDRDTMLSFAIELCVRYTVEAFDQYLPTMAAMPLREALSAYLVGGIEWSREQAGFLTLFARAAYQGGDADLAQRLVVPIAATLRKMIEEMLAQAVARGEIRPDVDLEATSRLIHALLIAVGDSTLLPYLNHYFQINDPALSNERLLNAMLDLILNGIGYSPQPPPLESQSPDEPIGPLPD